MVEECPRCTPGRSNNKYLGDFQETILKKVCTRTCTTVEGSRVFSLKQGQLTVSTCVHTFLQLSKIATYLADTEAKKVKRFINRLNPLYKAIVVAYQTRATFDDAVDRAFTAEEVHREKMAMNTKRSGNSWFKKGGQSKDKRQKQTFVARNENRPIYETCGKAHKT